MSTSNEIGPQISTLAKRVFIPLNTPSVDYKIQCMASRDFESDTNELLGAEFHCFRDLKKSFCQRSHVSAASSRNWTIVQLS